MTLILVFFIVILHMTYSLLLVKYMSYTIEDYVAQAEIRCYRSLRDLHLSISKIGHQLDSIQRNAVYRGVDHQPKESHDNTTE